MGACLPDYQGSNNKSINNPENTTERTTEITTESTSETTTKNLPKEKTQTTTNTTKEASTEAATGDTVSAEDEHNIAISLEDIPEYSDSPYVEINNNIPFFTDEEKQNKTAFENYSNLDSLGRCGVAYANLCKELLPTEERGEIGDVRPSGWHTVKYNDLIEGNYLYNRCQQ